MKRGKRSSFAASFVALVSILSADIPLTALASRNFSPVPTPEQIEKQKLRKSQFDSFETSWKRKFKKRAEYAENFWPSPLARLGVKTEDMPRLPKLSLKSFAQLNADRAEFQKVEIIPSSLDADVWQSLESAREHHERAVLLYISGRMNHFDKAYSDAIGRYDEALTLLESRSNNAHFQNFVRYEFFKLSLLYTVMQKKFNFDSLDQSFLYSSHSRLSFSPISKSIPAAVSSKDALPIVSSAQENEGPIEQVKRDVILYWPQSLTAIGCKCSDMPVLDASNVDELARLNIEVLSLDAVSQADRSESISYSQWEKLEFARLLHVKTCVLYTQEQYEPASRAAEITREAYEAVCEDISRTRRGENFLPFLEQEKRRVASLKSLVLKHL